MTDGMLLREAISDPLLTRYHYINNYFVKKQENTEIQYGILIYLES